MSSAVRSTKLKFKGDKTKKKRKLDDDGGEEGSSSRRKRTKEDDIPPDTWVIPEEAIQIRGPTFIVHPTPVSINFNSTTNQLVIPPLKEELADIKNAVPTDVAQVWVTTRIAGSTTINLRTGTGEGKFLSCDTHGIVSSYRDARGPQEEWTPVIVEGGMVAFMNVYEKYLGIDEVAGGTLQLRGDSETVGFNERFWVKIQSKYKKEAVEEEKKKNKEGLDGPKKIDEAGTNHIYQAWGAGRTVVSNVEKKELKKARKEGRLSEALLDARAKLKSDRFC